MTTTNNAKKIVLVGTVGAGTLAVIDQARSGRFPSTRIAIGVFASGVILAGLAEFAPNLAAGFATLMLATAAFVLGGGAWAGITAITAPKGVTP